METNFLTFAAGIGDLHRHNHPKVIKAIVDQSKDFAYLL
jgi:hypothetical protein